MRKIGSLLAALLLLAGGLCCLEHSARTVAKPHYEVMLEASKRTQAAFDLLREERLRRGYSIDRADDPNGTGMIGLAYSEITTTLGALEAKRSTANPNVAAMAVDLMVQAGLRGGERVAVNLSGSFPCLNVAVLTAAEAMGVEPVTISSVGASTYGANLPGFPWPEMEHCLWENGLLRTRSAAVSLGGRGDRGAEFSQQARAAVVSRLEGLGFRLLYYERLPENLDARIDLYGEVDALINVGGSLPAFGVDSTMDPARSGLLTALPAGERGTGLIPRYLQEGVPVIHLLNIKELLPQSGLPYDPIPLPRPGEGGVYRERLPSPAGRLCAALAALLACAALVYGFRGKGRRGGQHW